MNGRPSAIRTGSTSYGRDQINVHVPSEDDRTPFLWVQKSVGVKLMRSGHIGFELTCRLRGPPKQIHE